MPKKRVKTPRVAGETPWRKPCVNCHRTMAIVREGLCGLCARAAHKKTGAERDEALKQARQDAIRLAERAASREANKIFMPGTAPVEENEPRDPVARGNAAPPAAKGPGFWGTVSPSWQHQPTSDDQILFRPHEDAQGQPPSDTQPKLYPPPDPDPGAPAGPAPGSYPVSLIFTGLADEMLFRAICREAEHNRRSIANEILVALDTVYRCRQDAQSTPGKEQS